MKRRIWRMWENSCGGDEVSQVREGSEWSECLRLLTRSHSSSLDSRISHSSEGNGHTYPQHMKGDICKRAHDVKVERYLGSGHGESKAISAGCR